MADLRGYVEGLIGLEGDGTNVVANPTGTATDSLESVQIGETIYSVGGSNIPTPTETDRGKYLGVKSNANELEYREVREVPNPTGVEVGNVLTRTESGYMWSAPEEELPPYSTVQNDKVLGVHNGTLEWVEQSGGGGSYTSTLLYNTETWSTGNLTLNDAISDYDFLVFVTATNNAYATTLIPKDILLALSDYIYSNGCTLLCSGGYCTIKYINDTTISITSIGSTNFEKIYGLKQS